MVSARRRRRKHNDEFWLVVLILVTAAGMLAVAALRVAWPFLLAGVGVVVAWDCVALLRDRGARPRFRASRAVARLLGRPFRRFARRGPWGRRWERLRVRKLGELLVLTPSQFERAVATLLADQGYRDVDVRGGPGDLGVDIRCRAATGATVVVQCKRYAPGKSVGSMEMQLFVGMLHHHRADAGLYVTTSGFTRSARELARGYPITLLGGGELASMISASRASAATVVTPAVQP